MKAEVESLRAVLSLDKDQLQKEIARAARVFLASIEFLGIDPAPGQYNRWRWCRGPHKPKRPLPDWIKPGAPMPPKGK